MPMLKRWFSGDFSLFTTIYLGFLLPGTAHDQLAGLLNYRLFEMAHRLE